MSMASSPTALGLALLGLASFAPAPTFSSPPPPTRLFAERELKEQLTALLQEQHVRDRGELELRLSRSWAPLTVPDGPVSLKILDLPVAGVTPNFIVRFELSSGQQSLGTWYLPLQARIWREVWVTRVSLGRHRRLERDDVEQQRRDVLALREAPLAIEAVAGVLETAQALPAGTPLSARVIRLRPVMRPGQVVAAQVRDGPVLVTLKVEVLEEGAPGQLVRVRNLQSRREFRGKVEDEQTILVSL